MAVTIRGTATKLNITVGAVSGSLSDDTGIAAGIHKEVFGAAREKGNTPNRAARQLRNKTKRLLSIPDPPDNILCVNDETAFGTLRDR